MSIKLCIYCGGDDALHPWPEQGQYITGCIEHLRRRLGEINKERTVAATRYERLEDELRLWMFDENARGCGSFMLHHSSDLGGPYENDEAGSSPHDGTVRLTMVVQPLWPAGTWRLIPCCATMERRVKAVGAKESTPQFPSPP